MINFIETEVYSIKPEYSQDLVDDVENNNGDVSEMLFWKPIILNIGEIVYIESDKNGTSITLKENHSLIINLSYQKFKELLLNKTN